MKKSLAEFRCEMFKTQRNMKDSALIGNSHFNPLDAELNPICHLLVLLGAHHILHVSRKRVKYI